MDLGGAPPGDLRSAVEKNFHQVNYPRVVDLDSGDLDLADNNRKCQALKEGEVDLDVEGFRLERGKRFHCEN